MNKLTWTKTKPTQPDWYWTRVKNMNGMEMKAKKWTLTEIEQVSCCFEWAGPIPEDQLPQEPDPADAAWESLDSVPSRDYLPHCCQFGGLYMNKDLFRDLYHAFKQLIEKDQK